MEPARNGFIAPLTWSSCPLGCQDRPHVSSATSRLCHLSLPLGAPQPWRAFSRSSPAGNAIDAVVLQLHGPGGRILAFPGFLGWIGVSSPGTAGPKCREKAGAAPAEALLSVVTLGEHFSSQLLDRIISAGKPHIEFLPFFPDPKHFIVGGIPVYGRKLEQEDL